VKRSYEEDLAEEREREREAKHLTFDRNINIIYLKYFKFPPDSGTRNVITLFGAQTNFKVISYADPKRIRK